MWPNKICDWFVDNKLSIHVGNDKTESILFTGKQKIYIKQQASKINIKKTSTIKYIWCVLDKPIFGELMVLKVYKQNKQENKIHLKEKQIFNNGTF